MWGRKTLFIISLVIFVSFVPLIFDIDIYHGTADSHPLSVNLQTSNLVEISFACTLAATFPMLVDILLDLISLENSALSALGDRSFLLMTLILPAVAFFASKYTMSTATAKIYVCFTIAQRICLILQFFTSIARSSSGIWTSRNTAFLALCFVIQTITYSYWGMSENTGFIPIMVFLIISAITLLLFLEHYTRYLQHNMKMFYKGSTSLPLEEITPLVYSTALCLYGTTIFYSILVSGNPQEWSFLAYEVYRLTVSNGALVILAVVGTVVPCRTATAQVQETKRMLDLKRTFVRYISHEIRTPMNVSSLGMTILEDSLAGLGVLDKETMDLVAQIKDSLNIATEILNDLLTYEKLDSKLMVLETNVVEPVEFVSSSLRLFEHQANNANVKLCLPKEVIGATGNPHIRVQLDTYKMQQVLRNLVSNALKFTPKNGSIVVEMHALKKPSINATHCFETIEEVIDGKSSPRISSDWLRVEVTDTGVGIAPANLHKVFNEIIQFDANTLQAGKGSGLGLFISKGIVELHGGFVGVHSDGLGMGCTFFVELPMTSVENQERTREEIRCEIEPASMNKNENHSLATSASTLACKYSSITDSSSSKGNSSVSSNFRKGVGVHFFGKKVLVVDDSPVNLKIVSLLFKKLGATVFEASDGAQAVEMVQASQSGEGEFALDVIVMDNLMPIMSGPMASKLIRALGFNKLVLGLTGHALQEDVDEYKTFGADHVLTKPIKMDELESVMNRFSQLAKFSFHLRYAVNTLSFDGNPS